jgi:hypothetical protein
MSGKQFEVHQIALNHEESKDRQAHQHGRDFARSRLCRAREHIDVIDSDQRARPDHEDVVAHPRSFFAEMQKRGHKPRGAEGELRRGNPAQDVFPPRLDDLHQEEGERHGNKAVDDQIEMVPDGFSHWEEPTDEAFARQQANRIENRKRAEVNQGEVAGSAAKEEQRQRRDPDRQQDEPDSDAG